MITGLPYDMGFFSFVHELVFADLVERGMSELRLGSTIMKTTFTQIYDNAVEKANDAMLNVGVIEQMPTIQSAVTTLADIYGHTQKLKLSGGFMKMQSELPVFVLATKNIAKINALSDVCGDLFGTFTLIPLTQSQVYQRPLLPMRKQFVDALVGLRVCRGILMSRPIIMSPLKD